VTGATTSTATAWSGLKGITRGCSFLFSFLKMVKKMSEDLDADYMVDSLPRDSLSEDRGW
jgi:hypothetical protein